MLDHIHLTTSRFLLCLIIATLLVMPHTVGAPQTTTVIESDATQVQQAAHPLTKMPPSPMPSLLAHRVQGQVILSWGIGTRMARIRLG